MADPVLGHDVVINIDVNDVGGAGADWRKIAMQRGGSFDRNSDSVDTSSKDSGGWKQSMISMIGWGVSAEGALDPADPALLFLLGKWEARESVWVQIDKSLISGGKKEGQAVITSLPEEYPNSEAVTYTIELQGNGSLVDSP